MNLGMGFLMSQEEGFNHPGDPRIPATSDKPVTRDIGVVPNVDSWIPLTPDKPVMTNDGAIHSGDSWIPVATEKAMMQMSTPVANEMQRNQVNCHELLGLQGGISSEKPDMQTVYSTYDEVLGEQTGKDTWTNLLGLYSEVLQGAPTNEAVHELSPAALSVHGEHNKLDGAAVRVNGCHDQNSDWFMQNLMKDVNGAESRNAQAAEKLSLTSSYHSIGSECVKYQYANSMPLQQNQALSASQGIITSSPQNVPSDGIPIQYKHVYNLNSPPRAESTVVSCAINCFEFAPVTPDQGKQLQNQQLSDVQNFSSEESSRQEKDKLELISTSSQGGNPSDELLDNAAVKQPASNSTSLNEYDVSEDRGHTGIDLNKTPPQRTPRRKKHRPKVVVEGKPKKTPKPTPSKTKTSDENPSAKRKYVRRKGLETPSSRPGNETFGGENSAAKSCRKPGNETFGGENSAPNSASKSCCRPGNETFGGENSAPISAAKSCRRSLNFDLEGKTDDKSENKMVADQQPTKLKSKPFDLNLKSQDTIWSKGLNSIPDISAGTGGQQSAYNAEVQKGKSICNLIGDSNQKLSVESLPPLHTVPTTTVRDHTLDVIAWSLQTATSGQNNGQFGFHQGHRPLNGEGMGRMPLQVNSGLSSFDVAQTQLLLSSNTNLKDSDEGKEKRGSKRDHWHTSQTMSPHSADLILSNIFHHEIPTVEQNNNSGKSGIATLNSDKRRKFDGACSGVVSSMPSYVTSVQDVSRSMEFNGRKSSHESSSSSCTYAGLPNSNLGMQSTVRTHNSGGNRILVDQGINTAAVGNGFEDQRTSAEMQYLQLLMDLHHNAEAHNLNVTTGTTDCIVSPTQRVPSTSPVSETINPTDLSLKRQTLKPASSIRASQEKLQLNETKKQLGCWNSSKAKGPKGRQNYAVTIDEIIERLEGLEISKSGRELVAKEQNAIVPFIGDGKLVPYEGFDLIKRHKPRPKVDLDTETNRVWNLLMGKAGHEETETMDNEKEKWWEEERKVVRGRVDSFIARMHLVQGDRRFSPWKGSVVDSVIGVFLTQNVSDHLSSSAYMSLASKFPVQLRNSKPSCCEYGSISWIEEPDVQIVDPDGTITYPGRKIRQPVNKQNSMTLSELSGRRLELLNWGTVFHYSNENNSSTDEEVVSSQNSSESCPQSTKYVRSSSDSEVEDHIMMYNSKNCILESTPEIQRSVLLQQYQCQVMTGTLLDKSSMSGCQQPGNPASMSIFPTIDGGCNEHAFPVNSDVLCLQGSLLPPSGSCLNKTSDIEVNGSYCSGISDHKSMSSFFSAYMETNKIDRAARTSKEKGGIEGSATCSTTQETEIPINHVIRMDQTQSSSQHHRDKLQPGYHFLGSQDSVTSNQVQVSKSFQHKGKSAIEPSRLDEADAKGKTGHVCFSSEQLSSTGTNTPNAKRKRNVDKEKAFDWDRLRRKVLSKSGKKERCPDNMDSLDYEALRNADVKTISNTILERGMNNMLAERIKDFLNRLVRDHGSVDLEWLREVPADQVKDYLLSIRGLGLKSVECVRLLTLHQIAFPVDTNVGRIAVRLGWVPLRPLPESLQLHLLELYPVLESIQKYLWPRLCKLDQRTLYELHYQLITFGKVFCTKRKPNCNACPMRAECRHFASAFASARLALPGPEEKSIVNSTPSMAANEIPPITVEPVPLPPVWAIMGSESDYSGSKCEPIIEEPSTPEPSPELPESDIEDLFYEDPDEIPTINLSLEELWTNVESVIREQNMEIQEGDLSRALVALDTSTASIPVPKLKNVSRLRTEHQVYELPDSHPLLNGMERREPDDPSPYLLAIWGPGETGESTQIPEGCSSYPHANENNSQTVRGTLLIPCRTAMRGSFPLNGTYFQVNEMFADHQSSHNPIDVPRDWLWKLSRRTVYFGTSVTSIFRGLSQEGIQYCFWRGFVCVRGFDRKQRAPRPLHMRLHESASKMAKNNKNNNSNKPKKGSAEASNRKN